VSLLLHAVAPAPTAPPAAEPAVRWIEAGDLGVWASAWPAASTLGREEMLAHHRLVEALCAAGDCLPVRFGTLVADDDAARAALAQRAAALGEALARVRGRRELALTFAWVMGDGDRGLGERERPSCTPMGAGTRYLEGRRRAIAADETRRARAEELAQLVERELGVAGDDALHRIAPSERIALSSALLVPQADAPALAERARALGATLDDVELIVNGPWPPYTFATVA
jgi:hypothetical protein